MPSVHVSGAVYGSPQQIDLMKAGPEMASVLDAFDEFRKAVDADPDAVTEARRRRGLFRDALLEYDDILEIVPSGSLARGTHKDPIHDVDLIAVFDAAAHANWGSDGGSAQESLSVTGSRVNQKLGATNGTFARAVRLASPRNHAVKCFLDDPDDPDAFTVDVMPALRRDDKLLVPEALNSTWVFTDPELLIERVAERHAQWRQFASTVRMLKAWSAGQSFKIKSLVMEVLALELLPASNRPAALAGFFTAASWHVENGGPIEDPAKLCGEIQPDLDREALAAALRGAADASTKAMSAATNNNPDRAIELWREVFGDKFPAPTGQPATTGAAAPLIAPRPVKDTPQG